MIKYQSGMCRCYIDIVQDSYLYSEFNIITAACSPIFEHVSGRSGTGQNLGALFLFSDVMQSALLSMA